MATVRILLILECLLDLKSKQADVACAFLHAHLPPKEKDFVEMPIEFKQYSKNGKAKVLHQLKPLWLETITTSFLDVPD